MVLHDVVPPGEFFAAPAGDSPFTPGALLDPGTTLHRPTPAWTFPDTSGEPEIPFHYDVLYEDARLVVIDKPCFLPSTSNGRLIRHTVETRVRAQFGEEVTPIHRLDRLTSGVLVCARQADTRGVYQQLFARREVRKRYLARVRGEVEPGLYEVPMTKVAGKRQVRLGEGTWTSTSISVVEPGTVLLEPHTGFTHQLRALLNYLGAPIVGDDTYPVDKGLALDDFSTPLQLLASEISFMDPIDGTPRKIRARRTLPVTIM